MSRTRKRTWSELITELWESFRKWDLDPPTLFCLLPPRSVQKKGQTEEERTVTLQFRFRGRSIRVKVAAKPTAFENLEMLALTFESMRQIDRHNTTKLVLRLYELMLPELMPKIEVVKYVQSQPQYFDPAWTGQSPIPAHYRTIGVLPEAPLEIAEAVYQRLVRTHHPDVGGNAERMREINLAMEKVRAEKKASA